MTVPALRTSSADQDSAPPAKRRKVTPKKLDTEKAVDPASPIDEFQQVTLKPFVDQYRVQGMGFGGDVYYQSDVRLSTL
jgi:hypothetical protein